MLLPGDATTGRDFGPGDLQNLVEEIKSVEFKEGTKLKQGGGESTGETREGKFCAGFGMIFFVLVSLAVGAHD